MNNWGDSKRIPIYKNAVSRRQLLAGMGATVVGGAALSWSPAVMASGTLRYDGFGGTTAEATAKYALEPFTRATGISITQGTYGSQRDMLTKIRAGRPGDYHVLHMSGLDWYKRYIDLGYGTEINEADVPNLKWVMPKLVRAFRAITPNALSAVPFAYGTTGIAYNTKYVTPDEVREHGASILLQERYAGKMTGGGDAQSRIWYAALQDGQDPNNIEDMDAIWQKIREHRRLVKKYWGSGAEMMDLFAKEEAIIGDAWSGRVAHLQEQGYPIAYYEPTGIHAWIEGLMVLKGAPEKESAQLINYMLNVEVAEKVAEGQKYPPALDPSKVDLSEEVKRLPSFDPTGALDRLSFPEPTYWAERLSDWEKQWNRVKKGA